MIPILFQDTRFVVLDKPAGLPVHAGRAGGASVEDVFPALSRRKDGPWLAHRLDTDTAGCLVVALRKTALIEAQALFAAGEVEKVYWAVVSGGPAGEAGTIDAPLRKRTVGRNWRMVVDEVGDAAVSDWCVRGRTADLTWLEVRPRTGRTHQVRMHCAALGCPVLGDATYGSDGGMLNLLARSIRLPLDPPVSATAPVPSHMAKNLVACGYTADP